MSHLSHWYFYRMTCQGAAYDLVERMGVRGERDTDTWDPAGTDGKQVIYIERRVEAMARN